MTGRKHSSALFVTLAQASIAAADTSDLNAVGWDDDAIFYAIFAYALFNFYNRWVHASPQWGSRHLPIFPCRIPRRSGIGASVADTQRLPALS
jgi:hypothetical protein